MTQSETVVTPKQFFSNYRLIPTSVRRCVLLTEGLQRATPGKVMALCDLRIIV